MPVTRILPNGATMSIGYRPGNHERKKRGDTQGWTNRASRGNRDFLWSILADQLTGQGYAITLTVRDCPPSAADWTALRNAWVRRMKRSGMIRLHWLTEWQRRGVPHLHGAIWFPDDSPEQVRSRHAEIIKAWLEVASGFHPRRSGQDSRVITGAPGWFEYLAKHAARSVKNYQRSALSIPAGWRKTGRMWGHWGEWPAREKMDIHLNDAGFFRLRRLWVGYQIAKSRGKGDFERVRFLRSYLQAAPEVSTCRGMGEWLSVDLQLDMIAAVATRSDVEVES